MKARRHTLLASIHTHIDTKLRSSHPVDERVVAHAGHLVVDVGALGKGAQPLLAVLHALLGEGHVDHVPCLVRWV